MYDLFLWFNNFFLLEIYKPHNKSIKCIIQKAHTRIYTHKTYQKQHYFSQHFVQLY